MPQVTDVHYDLAGKAAERANHLMVADPRIPPQYFNVWVPSGQRNLGITFDEGMLSLDPTIVEAMREIGRRAVYEVLRENAGSLVGLILGEARKRRNYFDRHHQYAND